ncbi:MAG: glycosyltransferase family 2 protein [Rhodopirellula sp.]|nr:glycosyltransferase family 2 protein [Rhodopirellula sp.]
MIYLVLPAYNEEENLGELLGAAQRVFSADNRSYQVVLVDDGSRDGTLPLAEEWTERIPLRIVRHPVNQGLGPTLRDGLRAAAESAGNGDIVVAMDADNTHPPELVPPMARLIDEGYDLVIASRYQPGARVAGVSAFRRLLSWGANGLFRATFPIPGVRDYTCGFRAYRGSLLRNAFERYGDSLVSEAGFQSTPDLLIKLAGLAPRATEVPIDLRYDRKRGESKMRVAGTVGRTVGLIVRRRLNWR